mgnify:CR=1 FL=1
MGNQKETQKNPQYKICVYKRKIMFWNWGNR